MKNKSRERLKRWFFLLLWITVVYITLPIARAIRNKIDGAIPFAMFINFLLILGAIISLISILNKYKFKSCHYYLYFLIIVLLYGVSFWYVKIPDEKIHFFQYGLMAWLFWNALRMNFRDSKITYILSFILASLVGWGDELIQNMLPDRFYDLRDVLINSLSAFLSLCLISLLRQNGE